MGTAFAWSPDVVSLLTHWALPFLVVLGVLVAFHEMGHFLAARWVGVKKAGDYLYEPGGSIHELNTPASNTEDTDTFMVVTGSNVNFTRDGTYVGLMDAGMIKAWVDHGIKEQGCDHMTYITPPLPTYAR